MPKKNFAVLLIVVSAMLLATVPVCAQSSQTVPGAGAPPTSTSDHDIQMLRQNIQAQRKQITAANMPLTPDEATKFWPLYDQYRQEASKNGDERWALIKDYANNYRRDDRCAGPGVHQARGRERTEGDRVAHEVCSDLREGDLAEEDGAVLSDRSPGRLDDPATTGVDRFRWWTRSSPNRIGFEGQRPARCAALVVLRRYVETSHDLTRPTSFETL